MTVCKYFVGVPDLAAFKHARVHDIGAHEGRLHSVELVRQQLVGQRLVEAHCGKLTGTIILSQTKIKSVNSVCTSIRYLQYDSSNLLRLLFFFVVYVFEYVDLFADLCARDNKAVKG